MSLTHAPGAIGRIGLGTAPLGDLYAEIDEDEALATIRAALDGGITFFDTAPLYGHGLAEHRLGTVLRRAPRDVLTLSTKVGRVLEPMPRGTPYRSGYVGGLPHGARFDYSYDGAWRSLEQSLLRLGTARVDILLIHDVDVWTHGALLEERFAECMRGSYRALSEMRAQGIVQAIGVGVNEAEMCERFAREGDFDVMMLAGRYTLLEQAALDGFLRTAAERGIGVLLAGVFNSGILASADSAPAHYNYGAAPQAVRQRVAQLRTVCQAHGVSLLDAAVQFTLAHPAVQRIVLGAVTEAEVRRNLAAAQARLPGSLWRDLKGQGLLPAHAPVPADED